MDLKINPIEKISYKDFEIGIDNVSITYVQSNDCTEEEGTQTITISTRNNGISRFLNIKTGDEGWSIDNIDKLSQIINDFKIRASLNDN